MRKQIEMKESKDKLTIEEENRIREAERQARIANRASQDLSQGDQSQGEQSQNEGGIISRSRRAANIRSTGSSQGKTPKIVDALTLSINIYLYRRAKPTGNNEEGN